jgi:hypothetical protein
MVDLFKTISKDKFGFFDLTENIKDFEDYDQYSSNEYFKDKIEKIKEKKVFDNEFKDETRKHKTKSELIIIKATNERFFILYQLEKRKLEKRKDARITQCYIFKYNSEQSKI